MECLSKIAQTASADEDVFRPQQSPRCEVKALASNLEEEMQRFGREQLQWIQQELAESKAGHVLLQGQKRLQEQLSQLQETAITPQLDAMHERSRRFLMRLATDRKVKSKASQLFGVVEKHLAENGSLLSLLTDLGIEIPSALHQLLKAQAEGRVEDVETWKAALKSSLDDEVVVKGATGLVEHGEMMVAKLQELGENQAVARVVEQLQSEEIEREVLKSIRNFDPEKVLSTAEEALSNLEAREALILPSIHIDQVNGNENDCDWEISNINFSDFSFRKEDVHVTLNELNAVDEEVLCIRASGISAHFRDLKINLKSTFTAACIADAKAETWLGAGPAPLLAEQMSLDLAFRWAADQKPPRLVMSSRAIKMENLDLYDWSVSTLVNALSYLFAATLNRCACEKIESKLDEHVGIVVEGLNQCLVSCAPLLDRMGFQDFLKVSTKTLATPTLRPAATCQMRRSEDDGSWRPSDFLKAAFEAVTNDNIITTGAQEPSLSSGCRGSCPVVWLALGLVLGLAIGRVCRGVEQGCVGDAVTLKRHRGEFSRQTILATREWPMDLLMEDVLPIRVSALRFMQTSAACRFQDGRSMEDLVIDIISGQTRPWELPPVELVGDVDLIESPRQQQDLPLVWTRDHRRVWSLQAALAILRERIPGLEVLVPAKVRSQHDPKEMQDIARKFKTTSRHKNSGVRLALEGALQDLCREFGLVVTTLEMLERGLSARLCLSTQLYKSCFWVEMPLRMQELLH
eukprot:g16343.t1